MAQRKISFATVKEIGLALSGVEEGTTYGSPALKLRGELLACVAIHKSAEPSSLAVRISFEDRAALIAEHPDIYYLTDHYLNYPVVLVRMARIHVDALRDLLGMAWHFVNARKRSARSQKRRSVNQRRQSSSQWEA